MIFCFILKVVEDLMEEIVEEDVGDFVLPIPKTSDPDESTSFKDLPVERESNLNALKLKYDYSFDNMSMD